MPIDIISNDDIMPGDVYEDTFYHPCLCVKVKDGQVWGISLVDGSYPRCEEIGLSDIRKLTIDEAWIWRTQGPQGDAIIVKPKSKWW